MLGIWYLDLVTKEYNLRNPKGGRHYCPQVVCEPCTEIVLFVPPIDPQPNTGTSTFAYAGDDQATLAQGDQHDEPSSSIHQHASDGSNLVSSPHFDAPDFQFDECSDYDDY